jgi:hypothetical protein
VQLFSQARPLVVLPLHNILCATSNIHSLAYEIDHGIGRSLKRSLKIETASPPATTSRPSLCSYPISQAERLCGHGTSPVAVFLSNRYPGSPRVVEVPHQPAPGNLWDPVTIRRSFYRNFQSRPARRSILWLAGVLQGLVAGAYFPPSELPGPLYAVARSLPQTYPIDAVRRLLLHDEPAALARVGTLSRLASDVLIVAAMTMVTLVLGAIAFRLGIRKLQRDGGPSRWS